MPKRIATLSKTLFLISITALAFFLFQKADRMLIIYILGFMVIGFLGIAVSQMTTEELKKLVSFEKIGMNLLSVGILLFFLGYGIHSGWISTLSYLFLFVGSILYILLISKTRKKS